MNLFQELRNYLDANFKDLKLTQPLFFKDIPGLRFDLQNPGLDTSENAYFTEVVERMDKIHSVITDEQDVIMLLYRKYAFKRGKIRKTNYLFKQLNASTSNIQFKRNKKSARNLYGDFAYPSDGYCQVVIKDRGGNINFHNLYVAISHMDFGRIPLLSARDGELYIVNLSKNTIMLMYDDRGCDLVSFDVDLLQRYYNELSDLILEVNRPQIIERLQLR
jgi:hypothetical protein